MRPLLHLITFEQSLAMDASDTALSSLTALLGDVEPTVFALLETFTSGDFCLYSGNSVEAQVQSMQLAHLAFFNIGVLV